MNGRVCSDTVADVRERRKEFRESEVEFSHITGAMLSLFGQLLKSAMLEKLPLSFPIYWILLPCRSPLLGLSLVLPQPGVRLLILSFLYALNSTGGIQCTRLGTHSLYFESQAPRHRLSD